MKRFFCIALFLLLSQFGFAAQVKLITIGPGDAFWSAFGHTAIAIDDLVYGFGYFSFDEDIVSQFIANELQYELGVSEFNRELYMAQQQNRDLSVIELNLTAAQVDELQAHLKWHMLPENQAYRYDYFLDNCSTKVRDLLIMAWGHELAQQVKSLAAEAPDNSYMALTFPAKHQGLMNFGLALGYGWGAYTERSVWELMAFPVYLERSLMTHFDDNLAPKKVVFESIASNTYTSLFLTHWMLIFYVLLWVLTLTIQRIKTWFAKAWYIWHGFIGIVLLALWLLTPHAVADWNFNVLLLMPLGVLIVKYKQLLPVIFVSWLLWVAVAIYLQAWYLMPLLVPALMAWNRLRKNP